MQKDQEKPREYVRVKTKEIREIEDDISSVKTSELYVKDTDPAKFDVQQWMQPRNRYIFSIKKRPKGIPHIVYNEMARWEISEEEIRLIFNASGNSGILMFKDTSGQAFAVILGVHNYNVWCDITDDCKHGNIKKLAKEYWDGKMMYSRWRNLDRGETLLSDGSLVFIAIRQGRILGQRAFLIEISAGGDFRLDKVGPGDNFLDGW